MENLEPGRTYHIYNRGINSCRLFDDSADFNHFMMLYQRFMLPVVDTFAWVLMSNHFHLLVRIKENLVYRYSRGEDGKEPQDSQRLQESQRLQDGEWQQESQRLQDGEWQQESQRLQVSDAGVLAGSNLPSSDAENRPSSPDMDALPANDATWNLLKWQTMPMDGDGDGVEEGRKIPSATHHLSHLFNAYAKYYNTRHGRHGSLFERAFKRKVIDSKDYFQNVILYIHQNPVHHSIVQHPSHYIWSSYNIYLAQDETWLAKDEVFDLFGDRANFEFCHSCYNFDRLEDLEQ